MIKSRGLAIVLAIILGSIGGHRDYLGQIKLGVLYLLLSWTGISLIVSWIDAIMLILMNESEFQLKYNYNN